MEHTDAPLKSVNWLPAWKFFWASTGLLGLILAVAWPISQKLSADLGATWAFCGCAAAGIAICLMWTEFYESPWGPRTARLLRVLGAGTIWFLAILGIHSLIGQPDFVRTLGVAALATIAVGVVSFGSVLFAVDTTRRAQ